MTKICKVCGKEFAVTNKNQTKRVCSLACRTIAHRMAKRTSDIKTAIDFLGLEFHGERIASHYAHAKEKHPYFCDWFKPDSSSRSDMQRVASELYSARARIASAVEKGNLGWDDILNCEVWEILEALAIGDMAHAKEEVYDAVAVLLRLLDVIDGLQELGCIGKKEKKA